MERVIILKLRLSNVNNMNYWNYSKKSFFSIQTEEKVLSTFSKMITSVIFGKNLLKSSMEKIIPFKLYFHFLKVSLYKFRLIESTVEKSDRTFMVLLINRFFIDLTYLKK
jgi:hypothetical protein